MKKIKIFIIILLSVISINYLMETYDTHLIFYLTADSLHSKPIEIKVNDSIVFTDSLKFKFPHSIYPEIIKKKGILKVEIKYNNLIKETEYFYIYRKYNYLRISIFPKEKHVSVSNSSIIQPYE